MEHFLVPYLAPKNHGSFWRHLNNKMTTWVSKLPNNGKKKMLYTNTNLLIIMNFVVTIKLSRTRNKFKLCRVSSFQCRSKTPTFAKIIFQTFWACLSIKLDLYQKWHMSDVLSRIQKSQSVTKKITPNFLCETGTKPLCFRGWKSYVKYDHLPF